jgi:glutamyl-tRNA synthetase
VVVDDAASGITQVLRGADLSSSTARQIHLYRLLGLPVPRFAHAPLVLGPSGERLSKRDRAVSLSALKAAGADPRQMIAQLASLSGQSPPPLGCAPRALMATFAIGRVPRGPALVP